jgi:hypothetical protein
MGSNVHDSIAANDNAPMTSTLNVLRSWPYVDFTSLPRAQSYVSYLDDCSRTTLAGPMEDHGPFLSVPFQTQRWDCSTREYTSNQNIWMGARWTSRPGSLTVAMPHGEVLSPYNISVSALDEPGAHQSTNIAHSGAVSRKSNQYSDHFIWTPTPYAICCPSPTNTSSPIDPEAVYSWGEEANATEMMTGFCSRPLSVHGKQMMCYDHGCNGRKFSSISNLRRHQRERAGRTPLSFCCWCGAAFYRRWTRDHHVTRMSCLRIPR